VVKSNFKKLTLLFIFILLLIAPQVLDNYFIYLLNLFFIACIVSMGLNILTGFAGQVSLGQAAFFGIGAYTSSLCVIKLGLPFWLSLPLGGVIGAVISLVIGLPALKVSGYYLALVTLAFNEIVNLIMIHWKNMTNGTDGLTIPSPQLGNFVFSTDGSKYYIIFLLAFFLLIAARNILRSKTGRAFISLKDSEVASQCIGVNLPKYKIIAFMISAFYASLAGGLHGIALSYIHPQDFSLFRSIIFLMMIVIGGLGTLGGPFIGAALFTLLPEALGKFQEYQELIYALILLGSIIFLPSGLTKLPGKIIGVADRVSSRTQKSIPPA
jgi:branched-chain amino acid transport system permease protein